MSKRYVIIGCGVAGATAAEAIRERDEKGKITIYNGEPYPFYYRPALSLFMRGSVSEEKLLARPLAWAQARGLRILHEKVASVRLDEREVVGASGMVTPYDRLLIATGAWPVSLPAPGMNLQGVFTFRSIVCARRALDHIQKRKPAHAVVAGGGILGVELAETCRKLGMAVTLLCREPGLLTGFFSADMADAVAKRMEKDGVIIRYGEELAEARGSGTVAEAVTKSGDAIPAGILLAAVGARPVTEFLEGSGMPLSGGRVVVNSMLRSGAVGVYAAGDVALAAGDKPEGVTGGWLAAASQGERAGANMAGEEEDWRDTAYFNASSVYGQRYALVGRYDEPEGDGVRWAQVNAGPGEMGRIVLRGERIIGAAFLGTAALAHDAALAVERGARIGGGPERIEGMELSLLANAGAPAGLV